MTNIPAIRIKNFCDEWVLHNIDKKVDFYNGLTYTPSDVVKQDGTLVLRSSNVQGSEIVSADNVFVNSDVVNTDNVRIGDIVVVVRNGSKALLGKHAEVKTEMPNTVIGAFMTGIRTQNPPFVNALLSTPAFNEELRKNMGATINQITGSMFKSMEFYFPEDEEQKKIGRLFDGLDDVITLHQKKISKLISSKKAMLLKMFPQNGATVPEIRFNGYKGDWEKHPFSYYFEERDERSGEGELISVTIASGIKRFSELNRKDTTPEDMSKYKVVCKGDIAYNSMRMWQGASGYSPYTGILSPAYTVIVPKNNTDAKFFSYLIKKPDVIHLFEINSQGLTKDTWNLKFPAFSQIEIYAPSTIEEQMKIAEFFDNLDNLIALQEAKIEKLKKTKQALLNKMFV